MTTAAEAVFNHLVQVGTATRYRLHESLPEYTHSAVDMGLLKLERLGYVVKAGKVAGTRKDLVLFGLAENVTFDREQIRDRRGRVRAARRPPYQEYRSLTTSTEGESLSSLLCALFSPVAGDGEQS